MFPAVFLDRDGVIIENRDNYVRSWADVVFFSDSLSALASFSTSAYKIIIVTNQSAVGRGIISLETAQHLNRRVVEEIEKHGGRVDGIFMCPHAPADACACRKPRPGLLLQAARALDLDLSRSVMVGDALSDLRAGQNAGVARSFLVRSGRGALQASLPEASSLRPFETCAALANVLERLVKCAPDASQAENE